MANKSSTPPPDAVRLTEVEATQYVWELVRGWSNSKDIWAIRYGGIFVAGMCSVSGFFINNHYRTRLRIGKYGMISTLLPVVCLPGMFAAFFHRTAVVTDILLQKKDRCFLCYELKSAALQVGFGVCYPMIMGPLTAFMVANRYNTIRIPSFIKNPSEYYQFLKKTTKSLSGLLVLLATVQVMGSSALTYFELRNFIGMQATLEAIERKVDSS